MAGIQAAGVGSNLDVQGLVGFEERRAERMIAVGQEPVGNSPAEFAVQYKADIAMYVKIVEQAKIPKLD